MRNPWLDIEHEHDWLPVMNGTEENCGLCFIRRKAEVKVNQGEPMAKKKIAVEEVQEEVVEQVQHVVTHQDRLDSGTNWKVADQLPSLDD